MRRHDHFLNLLQITSFLISGVVVMKISERLNARRYKYLSMLLLYALPIAFAESLTTQVDNVACLIMLLFVYLVMDFWNARLAVIKTRRYLLSFICISILIGIGYLIKPSICIGMAVFMGVYLFSSSLIVRSHCLSYRWYRPQLLLLRLLYRLRLFAIT